MKITAAADDLAQGYEALRAQAVGELAALTPRGLGVFMRAGLPGWMAAFPPSQPTRPRASPAGAPIRRLDGLGVELVSVLAAMALGCQRRCA